MRLGDLLQRLDAYCAERVLAGMSPAAALEAAQAGGHPHPTTGEALAMLLNWTPARGIDDALTRGQAVDALGPLRRRYMEDAAPAEGLREVQAIIEAMDAAFDDEALESGRQSQG